MNPEAYKIVEAMKSPVKAYITADKPPIASSDIQNFLSAQTAQLLVLLAEEAEKQNEKVEEQTQKMIRFTKAIYSLTLALIFIGIVQIILAII